MKIYFSPEYSADAYVNLQDCGGIEYDCVVVGLGGFVSLIELHLGLHNEPASPTAREAQWLRCMRMAMGKGPNCLSESWSKNALGVSNECLRWRDSLRQAKWKNSMAQPDERFDIIAKADKTFDMPGIGDRMIGLLAALDRNPLEEGSSIHVGAASPEALIPVVAELLGALSRLGATVVYDKDQIAGPAGSNLAKVQQLLCAGAADGTLAEDDDTFRIWEFETSADACRYIASLPSDDFDLYAISDGKLLDNTQLMLGQATSGTTIKNSSPQIAQMFLLGMNLFEYPLNINNLLAWLQLPLHPIKSELRHALVKAIVDTSGFDNERYRQAKDQYLEGLPDDQEREKTKLALEIFDVRPDETVNVERLRVFNSALCDWASQMSAIEDIDMSKRQQLHVVAALCGTLDTLLQDVEEKEIPYRRLEAAISTLFGGAEFRICDAQAGARTTASCSDIAGGADEIIWIDCYNYVPKKSPYDFLNDDERCSFEKQGCEFQRDDDFNRAAIRSLKLPVLRARKCCVIVTAKRNGGADTTQHPVMIQLQKGFGDSIGKVLDRPALDRFETHAVDRVDNSLRGTLVEVACKLKMPVRESYTSLDQLIQYPLDYVLDKIARIYTSASTDLKELKTVKGDVAHKAIEMLFVGNVDDIASNIKESFDSVVDCIIQQQGAVLLLPENEIERIQYKSELRECLEALLGIIRDNNLSVVDREHEIKTKIGLLDGDRDPEMKGFIDMVLSDSSGNRYIFDFKWTSRKKTYREMVEQNVALQLAIYKRMLANAIAEPIAACAYFTMPWHEMYTASAMLAGANVVRLNPVDNSDRVEQAIRSYRYRRDRLEKGKVDFEEGFEIASLEYNANNGQNELYPLKPEYGNETIHASNNFSNFPCFKSGMLI